MFFEDLIRFFLQNFVIFLVVLIGISRLFQRTISSKQDRKTFEPRPIPPILKPVIDDDIFSDKVERKKEQTADIRDEQFVAFEKPEQVESNENEWKRNEGFSFETERDFIKQQPFGFYPSKPDLKSAVIWSEILGPPRAYKKHTIRRSTCR